MTAYSTSHSHKNKNTEVPHLARLISSARHNKDMTQLELARILGYKSNAVSVCRWERGTTPVPPSQYLALSKALDVSLESILRAAKADDPHNIEEFDNLQARLNIKPQKANPNMEIDLRPDLRIHLKELQSKYSKASLQALHDSAIETYCLLAAQFGLDGNLMPKGSMIRHKKASHPK